MIGVDEEFVVDGDDDIFVVVLVLELCFSLVLMGRGVGEDEFRLFTGELRD
jgi:hypothetical protein